MAGWQADAARAAGEREAKVVEERARRERVALDDARRRALASGRVALAGSGIDAGSGSAVEVLSGHAAAYERELLDMEFDSRLRAEEARYGGALRSDAFGDRSRGYALRRNRTLLEAGIGVGAGRLW
ncbi:hypothetical protein GGQ74_002206 [Desulfobaculum xiamenense]|uniref:Uncharacterized protein n=1 Tax=Desulfobaculum xiamenense TaxID=995050 RepID=A0A846QQB4_9BACT|nr:hypothetical protein [Desulfobaculum xiamenense]NJB68533.1 hypothetical protein [Desulfobaculum xiamenense]